MAGDGGDLSPTDTGAAAKMRKRTKTGCLTCRKRRIKCGEERPTCANCIKSKRQCEGYHQRVVFKPPLGDWPNHPGVVSTLQYHNSNLPGSRTNTVRQEQPSPQFPDSGLASIQPRPLTQYEYATENSTAAGHPAQPYSQGSSYQPPLQSPHHHQYQQALASPHHQLPTPTSATSYFSQPSPIQTNFQGQQYAQAQYPVPYGGPVDTKPAVSHSTHPAYYQQQNQERLYAPQTSVSSGSVGYPAQDFSLAEAYTMPLAISHANTSHSAYQPAQTPQGTASDVNYMHQHAVYGMSRV